MLRGLDDGLMLVDAHRAVALFAVVVALMIGLARFFASFCTTTIGWRKMEEVTFGACTHGAIS